jgi:hypothetical protein
VNKLFIKKNDFIKVDICIGLDAKKEKIFADLTEDKLIKNNKDLDATTIEKHSVTFKRPNYGEMFEIMKNSVKTDGVNVEINPILLRHLRLTTLLKEWTFKNEDDTLVKISRENIENLNPIIANIISMGLEEQLNE